MKILNNLHISLNDFRNQSRVLKQTNSLVNSYLIEHVFIAALWAEGLQVEQIYAKKITCNRFALKSRSWSKNFFFQLFKYFEFSWKVYQFYKDKNIKLINIHSVGLLPLGVFLKWVYKAKLVYDTHELETETNGLVGFRKKAVKTIEKIFIRKADLILVVGENIADWYGNAYHINRPQVVLNVPNQRALKRNNHFREQLGIRDDQIILLYQGGLAAGRGVHLILEAFKARSDDKVVAVFMGYGPLQHDIQTAATQQKNIFFYPAVAPQIVLEYTSSADFGIHLIQNTCLNHNYCMPNKLFEYAMAGLPVLVSNMKDMSELVRKNQMGAVISDFSVAGINQAIDDLLVQDLTTMKANAYRMACENSWEVQEQKMLTAYQGMLGANG